MGRTFALDSVVVGTLGSELNSYPPVAIIANGSVTTISSAVKTNVEADSASYTL
jgi:hypothetical protein